jgi:hypothetical protein
MSVMSGLGVMKSFRNIFCSLALAPCVSHGEVKLLTGDANNAVHQRGGQITDLSADGNLVLFTTLPPTTGSAPGITASGLYLRNISADTLQFVGDTTITTGVVAAEMSDDGRYLTWSSSSPRRIYWRDRTAGITREVTAGATGTHGDPRMSGDGRYVAFVSSSRDMAVDVTKLPDVNRGAVFLYDSVANSISIVSLAHDGGRLKGVGPSSVAAFSQFDLSGDGRFVVYTTEDKNVHPDMAVMTASFFSICRRNLATGEVILLNRNSSGNVSNGNFGTPRISADGARVAFTAAFIGFFDQLKMIASLPGNTGFDVYAKDVPGGDVWGLTKTSDGTAHDGALGTELAINDNGSVVSFASSSDKLIPGSDSGGGHSGSFDVFRTDLGASGAFTLSQMTLSPTNSGNVDYRDGPFLPGTGNYVAFGTDQIAAMGIPNSAVATSYHGIGVGTFPAVVSGALTFSDWGLNLPSGMRGAGDNPSGDGVKNAVKYFIGSNATAPDLRFLPEEDTATGTDLGLAGDDGKYLTLRVRIRRDLPAGYTWAVHASATLSALISSPVNAVEVGAPVADGDFDIHIFRFPTAIGGGTGFMRLYVNVP